MVESLTMRVWRCAWLRVAPSVVGINEGTKSLSLLLHGTKVYEGTGVLGARTETEDIQGSIVEMKPYDHVTREALEKVLVEKFTGEILQVPPM